MITKRILATVLFILISCITNAQSNNSLVGKWVYADIHGEKFTPEMKLSISENEIFSKMSFDFKEDGKLETYLMGQKLSGTWKRGEGAWANKFRIYTEIGPSEYDIIKLTASELIIKIGTLGIIMKKIAG